MNMKMNVKNKLPDDLFPSDPEMLEEYLEVAKTIQERGKRLPNKPIDCKPEDLKFSCGETKLRTAEYLDEILRKWDRELIKIVEEKYYEYYFEFKGITTSLIPEESEKPLVSKITVPDPNKFQQYIEGLELRLGKDDEIEVKKSPEKTDDPEKIEKTENETLGNIGSLTLEQIKLVYDGQSLTCENNSKKQLLRDGLGKSILDKWFLERPSDGILPTENLNGFSNETYRNFIKNWSESLAIEPKFLKQIFKIRKRDGKLNGIIVSEQVEYQS